jgi:hypothetical protein
MAASARTAYLARRGAEYGIGAGIIKVDLKKDRLNNPEHLEGDDQVIELQIFQYAGLVCRFCDIHRRGN